MIRRGSTCIPAAVAVPNFSKAIGTAQQRACGINRKNIDGAKLQWALEQQQPPTAIPTDEDLIGENRYLEHKPDCPARGVYSLNAVKEKCTCNASRHAN